MATTQERAGAHIIDEVAQRARQQLQGRDADEIDEVEDFVRRYWQRVPPTDLVAREPSDLLGAALAHLRLAERRAAKPAPAGAVARVYTPSVGDDGWQTPHSVVDVVAPELAFIVDSLAIAVERCGLGLHLIVDPIMQPDVYVHIEVDRLTDAAAAAELQREVDLALDAVSKCVGDWLPMRQKALDLADELANDTSVDPEEAEETAELLRWLADNHYVFICYDGPEGDDHLGVGCETDSSADLPELLSTTKTPTISLVHRLEPMDQIDVRGGHRFLGLFTHAVYRDSVRNIPVVRRKVKAVLDKAAFAEGSHGATRILAILEGHPRDELFQATVDELHDVATGLLSIRERQAVRAFVRRDPFNRYASCLAYVPKDRFNTDVRKRIQAIFTDAAGGTSSTFTTELSTQSHARLHVIVTEPSAESIDVPAVEERITRASRDWSDDLRRALLDQLGEATGLELFGRWASAFPAGYRAEVAAAAAVSDIQRIESLGDDDLSVRLHQPMGARASELRLKLYRTGSPVSLSEALPVLKELGVTVLDEVPSEVNREGAVPAWIYDFGLRLPDDAVDEPDVRRSFEEAFLAAWSGKAESDGLGRLILTARLSWRQVSLLRALRQYLRQAGTPFSQGYLDETLTGSPTIACLLVELFEARFDPDLAEGGSIDELHISLDTELAAIQSLDQDRILRSFAAVVDATVRTSLFRDDQDPELASIVFKFDPSAVPDLPLPRPKHEIFVYAPHVEGVHLRMGRVARGGLRWSDRREDFRTEVLGLVKAQTVKNAVIVPVGAKGGFVPRRLPTGDRDTVIAEVVRCYRTFISGMLDVTDNLVNGEIVSPPRVRRDDKDDPYLVVAADKGTATFSDIANGISLDRGFWLGDAFASGGSAGYDHKVMGITARGAWESVKFHFRHLGVDVQNEDFTVVGIGDMSGDVFGNGMLLSRHIRLLAAFDHRHVFVDPNPDAERSWQERERLFNLPGSSWTDYDSELVSEGGGVFSRTSKAIEVTPQMAEVLGLDPAAGVLTPPQLMNAILKAPVDLFWNGGIGTYVKATSETNEDAADRANDILRVSASELRCRVIGEGGNLGMTQRSRIEFAHAGGMVNTDAIDNSAGVDCSDHEVNLKILLDQVVRDGDLTTKQRNELLAEMTEDVAALVLADNRAQNVALAAARTQAPGMVDVHIRHLARLEQVGGLVRDLEFLPSDEELLSRQERGDGLTQPELAVLLAYTKISLAEELLASDLPEDASFADELSRYFPDDIRSRYADQLEGHPLRRELIVTQVTNRLVNTAGISMTHRLQEETSAGAADIARAHQAAWDVFDLGTPWKRVDGLDGEVDAQTQTFCELEIKKLGERATRWFLRNRRVPFDVDANVRELKEDVQQVVQLLPKALIGSDRAEFEEGTDRLTSAGVPEDLAVMVAAMPIVITALDIVDLAHRRDAPLAEVAATYFLVDERLSLGWLRGRITQLPRGDRWQALARSALRDDFFAEHKGLVDEVLASDGAGTWGVGPADLVDKWMTLHRPLVDRCIRVLADIRASGTHGLAQLSVALREFRNLRHQVADR